MDQLLDQAQESATSTTSDRHPFRIVIIYENIVSAARALRACELLRGEISREAAWEINVWKMSSLGVSGNMHPSASAAARADVVIISASGREDQPPGLHRWVDEWLGQGAAAGSALFTLLGDHATPGAVSFASWLQGKAAPCGIDVFSHPATDLAGCAPLRDIPLLMPPGQLPDAIRIPIEEWRPGSVSTSDRFESAFDIIENFGAHLRARLEERRLQNDHQENKEKPDALFC
ncbi:MAG: hypothetical protein WCG66_06300 [bacterium]